VLDSSLMFDGIATIGPCFMASVSASSVVASDKGQWSAHQACGSGWAFDSLLPWEESPPPQPASRSTAAPIAARSAVMVFRVIAASSRLGVRSSYRGLWSIEPRRWTLVMWQMESLTGSLVPEYVTCVEMASRSSRLHALEDSASVQFQASSGGCLVSTLGGCRILPGLWACP